MDVPQHEQTEDPGEEVVPGVDVLHEPAQSGQLAGRWVAINLEGGLQRHESRGPEGFVFEPAQYTCEEVQVLCGSGDRTKDPPQAVPEAPECGPVPDEREEERRAERRRDPVREGDRTSRCERDGDPSAEREDAEDRQDTRRPPQPRRREQLPLLTPGREGVGPYPGARVLAEHGEILPEIELGRELADRVLPGDNGFRVCRGQQPRRQRLFAHTGAGVGEELEQRPIAEQVEVTRVQMPLVEETRAGVACPGPVALQPRDRALKKSDGPSESVASRLETIEDEAEPDHDRERREQPPARDGEAAENGDAERRGRAERQQPKGAGLPMLVCLGGVRGAPRIQSVGVGGVGVVGDRIVSGRHVSIVSGADGCAVCAFMTRPHTPARIVRSDAASTIRHRSTAP